MEHADNLISLDDLPDDLQATPCISFGDVHAGAFQNPHVDSHRDTYTYFDEQDDSSNWVIFPISQFEQVPDPNIDVLPSPPAQQSSASPSSAFTVGELSVDRGIGTAELLPMQQPSRSGYPAHATLAGLASHPPASFPSTTSYAPEIMYPLFRQYSGDDLRQDTTHPNVEMGRLHSKQPNWNTSYMADTPNWVPNDPLMFHQDGPSQELPQPVYSPTYTPDHSGGMEADDEPMTAIDPSYAKLLERCLRAAPSHELSLKDIYEWVSIHSTKAKDPGSKGWQNSVRHNLSMNKGFEKVTFSSGPASKKGAAGCWRLTEEALANGVISTTRFRKESKKRHDRSTVHPALKRQESGAKGGRATRDAQKRQRMLETRPYHPTSAPVPHHLYSNPAHYQLTPSPDSAHFDFFPSNFNVGPTTSMSDDFSPTFGTQLSVPAPRNGFSRQEYTPSSSSEYVMKITPGSWPPTPLTSPTAIDSFSL